MYILSKTLIAATVALVFSSTLAAQEIETVSFRYDKTASIEQNFAAFGNKARRACARGGIAQTYRVKRACEKRLVAQAVKAPKLPQFIALLQKSQGGSARKLALRSER